MSKSNAWEYEPDTLLDSLDLNRVVNLQQRFQRLGMPVEFDPSYIRHLSAFHGGVPKRRWFSSQIGREYSIERFLNFVDHHHDRVAGLYSIEVIWTQIEDRLNDYLVPFAILFGGDCLCFDYEFEGPPSVVVWLHEDSDENDPATDYVSATFDEFLHSLRSGFGMS